MSRIVRTPQAEDDLLEIWRFIADDRQAPSSADELLRELEGLIKLLASQPLIGQSLGRVRQGLRMFSKGNYVIFYSPLEDGLVLHRVLHAARNWRELI
jgi:toxin ParE1/3/4